MDHSQRTAHGRTRDRKGWITFGPRSGAGERSVVFVRRFRRLRGGHLKVYDYFNHALAMPGYTPVIRFAPGSRMDATNPWMGLDLRWIDAPARPSVLFLAGTDWRHVPKDERDAGSVPVINLIQGLRHGDERIEQFAYLSHRAIRICVSVEVAKTIESTGRVRGPIITIPNAIDVSELRTHGATKSTDVVIAARKQPELGSRIRAALARPGREVVLLNEHLSRAEFLHDLASAKVALLLPHEQEGFYLPALEAMALGTVVICPDVGGNRSFCLPDRTAIVPRYRERDLVVTTEDTLHLPDADRQRLVDAGHAMADEHDLASEREAFHDVLARVDELWQS